MTEAMEYGCYCVVGGMRGLVCAFCAVSWKGRAFVFGGCAQPEDHGETKLKGRR